MVIIIIIIINLFKPFNFNARNFMILSFKARSKVYFSLLLIYLPMIYYCRNC